MKFAQRMARLGTETAFEVLARARQLEAQGKHIIHLEIGEPDLDTPRNIRDAAKKALDEGWTHYGPSAGLPEMRKVIAEDISRRRGISVNPDMVVVTPGAKPIMSFAIMALVDEGDEVIYPNPGFPIYESMIDFMGGVAVPVYLREENDFRLDLEELKGKVTKKTKLIIINSPQNPTGGILTREDLQVVADLARNNDIMVLADEIYCRIVYEGRFESITQFPGMMERTIILDGFSKTYAMTGWRLGYGVMPEPLAAHLARLMTNVNSCTASFTQRAGMEGIRGPQDDVDRMVAEFKRRRDVIVDGLNKIPNVSCRVPRGAFYVFPNIKKINRTGKQIADHLLVEGGVACLAGTCFGSFGEGYLRFSYANSVENIQEGLRRVEKALAAMK